jgi:predicted ribosomally synthesized peptide with nif11-like leader
MPDDQLSAFAAAVESDPALQEKLSAAAKAYAEAVVAIASRAGFKITADQVQAAQNAFLPEELSDEELSKVAGGGVYPVGGVNYGGWASG